MVIRIAALVLVFPALALAQTHVVGYGGAMWRLQASRLDFTSFRSGPISTVSPVLGAGAATSLWKIRVDGAFLWSPTGEKEVFLGPNRSVEQKTQGTALTADAGGGWPLLKVWGFQTIVRGGYGWARVRVPTQIQIEESRHFWNYGVAATKNISSRYLLRIDVRNIHFRREEVPQTLGRSNIATLAGVGFRW